MDKLKILKNDKAYALAPIACSLALVLAINPTMCYAAQNMDSEEKESYTAEEVSDISLHSWLHGIFVGTLSGVIITSTAGIHVLKKKNKK